MSSGLCFVSVLLALAAYLLRAQCCRAVLCSSASTIVLSAMRQLEKLCGAAKAMDQTWIYMYLKGYQKLRIHKICCKHNTNCFVNTK